jgi:hypothetical protein
MDFDSFEQVLGQEMRDAKVSAPLIDVFLSQTVRRIRKISGSLPSRAATLPVLGQLVRLCQQYLNYLEGSGPISSFIRGNRLIQQMYRSLCTTLRSAHAVAGVSAEIQDQQVEEQEATEREQRREEAAQWVPEIDPYPKSSASRITVGEFAAPWRIYKIHQSGTIYAVNEDNLEVATFNPSQWYQQRGIAKVVRSFAWLRVLEQNPAMQFLAGLVEGIGKGILGLAEAILRIDQTLLAIGRALADLAETGRAIWQSIKDWYHEYVVSGTPGRARMIGEILGGLVFEIVLTKGIGRVAMLARAEEAAHVLRSRSIGMAKETLARFRKGVGRAAPTLAKGIEGAIELLRSTRILHRAADVLRRTKEIVRARLQVAQEWFVGALHVAEDAYYFLFDKAREWMARIGARLDEWAWGQRNGIMTLHTVGPDLLGEPAAALWRRIRLSMPDVAKRLEVIEDVATQQGIVRQEEAILKTYPKVTTRATRRERRRAVAGKEVHKWFDKVPEIYELIIPESEMPRTLSQYRQWISRQGVKYREEFRIDEGIRDRLDRMYVDENQGIIFEVKPKGTKAVAQVKRYEYYMNTVHPLPEGRKWITKLVHYDMEKALEVLTNMGLL